MLQGCIGGEEGGVLKGGGGAGRTPHPPPMAPKGGEVFLRLNPLAPKARQNILSLSASNSGRGGGGGGSSGGLGGGPPVSRSNPITWVRPPPLARCPTDPNVLDHRAGAGAHPASLQRAITHGIGGPCPPFCL